jgi:hypothetical protein
MAAMKKTVMKRSKSGKRQEPPRPVYFLSLSIENVRCFGPKQTLDLSDGKGRPARWTVILGNNGVGKTTLLQCLTAFESAETGQVSFIPRVVWEVLPSSFPQERQGARALADGEVLVGGSLREDGGNQYSLGISWRLQEPNSWQSSWPNSLKESLEELVCYGYGATRRMGAGALSTRKLSRHNDSLFHEDVPLRNAEEWLLQLDYASSKRSPAQADAQARHERVTQVLKDLLPDIDDIRFVLPTAESPAAQVEFKTPYGWVGMQSLSLGYRTLIAWMVDLASRLFERYPDSPNPLAEPAVVLVDEIDLHLHPTWQRRLIGYLNEHFPKAQFIVTAHSPLVVQSATDANIVVLRPEGDHVVIDNDVASIRGWRVDQILTSDLFGLQSARPPELDTLLAERTALLSKARLTKKDKARLDELEKEIGPLPAGETQTQREALDIIQRFAARVGKAPK